MKINIALFMPTFLKVTYDAYNKYVKCIINFSITAYLEIIVYLLKIYVTFFRCLSI